MKKAKPSAHPYMANSPPEIKREMLNKIGAETVEELFEQIPADHRLKKKLKLPEPILSESELKRHLTGVLAKNKTWQVFEVPIAENAKLERQVSPSMGDDVDSVN